MKLDIVLINNGKVREVLTVAPAKGISDPCDVVNQSRLLFQGRGEDGKG